MRVVYGAYVGRNQSGAERDNKLLFGEQWILLFSKSNIVSVIFQPIRSRLENSRWRRPWKCGHVGKQPTSLNGGPGIGLTDFHGDTIVTKSIKYLKCPAPKRTAAEVLAASAMMKTEKNRSEFYLYRLPPSAMGRWRHREPIGQDRDVSIHNEIPASQYASLKESIKPWDLCVMS